MGFDTRVLATWVGERKRSSSKLEGLGRGAAIVVAVGTEETASGAAVGVGKEAGGGRVEIGAAEEKGAAVEKGDFPPMERKSKAERFAPSP